MLQKKKFFMFAVLCAAKENVNSMNLFYCKLHVSSSIFQYFNKT